MNTKLDHAALIRPFLSRDARARYTELASGAKKRARLIDRLCHGYESTLDWRLAQAIPTSEQTAEAIAHLLKRLGAGETCYVLCASYKWDDRQLSLSEALGELVGNGRPVLLVCVPDALAYFEPEYGGGAGRRFVLQKTT
jgi:hypothetical protein